MNVAIVRDFRLGCEEILYERQFALILGVTVVIKYTALKPAAGIVIVIHLACRHLALL
jgi:hypothetical protein